MEVSRESRALGSRDVRYVLRPDEALRGHGARADHSRVDRAGGRAN